ncbi:prepilin-type N-terminal cleavage/methylation domain-containing protein [Kosakonia sp. BYX6]|uniref:Prepilin-type N-terminal cleavage/methylation domain-containing protein n=1 Tax=Kosakonia calanthes TaxID=3139408 RepID=A0ABZ3B4H2_9ENTR
MRNGEKGFTLIELLVVMAIIATLMTLVAPRFFGQTERAKVVVLEHNRNAIRTAIAAWRHDYLSGPERLDELVDKGYLFEIPLDPVSNSRDSWEVKRDEDQQIIDVTAPSLHEDDDDDR